MKKGEKQEITFFCENNFILYNVFHGKVPRPPFLFQVSTHSHLIGGNLELSRESSNADR